MDAEVRDNSPVIEFFFMSRAVLAKPSNPRRNRHYLHALHDSEEKIYKIGLNVLEEITNKVFDRFPKTASKNTERRGELGFAWSPFWRNRELRYGRFSAILSVISLPNQYFWSFRPVLRILYSNKRVDIIVRRKTKSRDTNKFAHDP